MARAARRSNRLAWLAVFAAVIGGGLYWKIVQDRDNVARTRVEALKVLADANGFEANEDYFTALLDGVHQRAFDHALHSGRKQIFGRLDGDRYLADLLRLMREQAQRDGRADIHAALVDLEARLELE